MKNRKYAYRLCPCNAVNIEGIQTWLEDLAAEGLLLEEDGAFLGIWRFRRTAPQQVRYRLEVVQQKFLDDTYGPQEEMLEAAEAMGWEYVTRYRFFYIYRTADPAARPFHTDPAVHALTVKKLKRQHNGELILDAIYVVLMACLRGSRFGNFYRDAAALGPWYTLSLLGLLLCLLLIPLSHVLWLRKYVNKLRRGEPLEDRREWKPGILRIAAAKVIPPILAAVWLCSVFSGWIMSTKKTPMTRYSCNAPFASIEEVYPEGEVLSRTDMGDYNTFLTWENPVSRNTEWNESGTVSVDGKTYHFILRITCYETGAQWIARGLARDLYAADFTRYGGKRFEALEAPETEAEELRVYSSYSVRKVVLRQGNTVIHGTVSIDEGQEADHWQQWLDATLEKMKR